MMPTHLSGLLLALAVLIAPVSFAEDDLPDDGREVLDMGLESPVGFSMRSVTAPFSGLFRGPGYWYSRHTLDIETVPADAVLDLFYVRANFQKRYEQADAPVRLILPPRIEVGPRDFLVIRAFAEGYGQKETRLKIETRESQVVINLDPLPNTVIAVRSRYFAGRASLTFLTKERIEPRLQKRDDGFVVILQQTGLGDEAGAAIRRVATPLVAKISKRQLGEDLVLRVHFADATDPEGVAADIDLRSRQGYDVARELHEFSVDLVPADRGADSVNRAREALASVAKADVSDCALVFDDALRENLDAGALSRALEPRGDFTDRYLRAAMRRLGDVVPAGVVHFADGSSYRPSHAIELEAALSQAGAARGYLALLRRLVAELEPANLRAETLRGLVAPELDFERFRTALDRADASERACAASS